MKKRQILALALTGVMVLAGCGGNKDTTEGSAAAASKTEESSSEEDSSDAEAESTSEKEEESLSGTEEGSTSEAETESDPIMDIPVISGDFSLADCVKLGEYKGLELEMDVEPVTDEYLETYLGYMVDAVETEDPDAVVENGDIVNLDFVGKLDGEAFDGGSGEGYDLEIGSGTFIPGFEDQMVGMKKGETRDLELTFPESYVENLAGKDVVFTVTVNAIKRMPEMNDEWVQEFTGGEIQTLEEFRAAKRLELEEENRAYAENMLQSDAWQEVLDNSEILAFPEKYLEESVEEYEAYVEDEAEMYEMEKEEYLEQIGMTLEAFENYRDLSARNQVKNRLILEAVVEAENISSDEEDFREAVSEMEESYGMTEQELKDYYGERTIDEYLYTQVVMDRLMSYAVVTETEAAAAEE